MKRTHIPLEAKDRILEIVMEKVTRREWELSIGYDASVKGYAIWRKEEEIKQ